jgi:multidrug transporter EmrE-like cation transporter
VVNWVAFALLFWSLALLELSIVSTLLMVAQTVGPLLMGVWWFEEKKLLRGYDWLCIIIAVSGSLFFAIGLLLQ